MYLRKGSFIEHRQYLTMKSRKLIGGFILVASMVSCSDDPLQNRSSIKSVHESEVRTTVPTPIKETQETHSEILAYAKPKFHSNFILISSGQLSPYTEITIDKIPFKLVQNEELDSIYLSTSDDKFVTPEGYKTGTKWKNLTSSDQEKVESMLGWGYFVELASGWQLGFCEGSSCTDQAPTDNSEVAFIFKRKTHTK